jgi:phosphohistidine swiveling domain-containing protein
MGILQLDERTQAPEGLVGGKAANLLELIRLGMPVPAGMILTAAAYQEQAGRCGLTEKVLPFIEKRDWKEVEQAARAAVAACPLDRSLHIDLLHEYRRMGSPAVAVRSSATCEDQAEASFAGQFETLLNVRGEEELVRAIRTCWASLWNRRALSYRHRRGIDHFSVQMAVVIQEMVPAEAAGVLFTLDPVTGRDEIRVEIAPGLGEALVSGIVAGEVYQVDRGSLQRTGGEGDRGLLDAGLLADLCRLALAVEEHFGCPQDIEFAVVGGDLHLLQARPMTSLAEAPIEPLPPPGRPSYLDRMIKPFVDERYAMAPRPLDNMVFRLLVGGHIYAFRELGGIIRLEDYAAFRGKIWWQAYRLPPVGRLWIGLLRDFPSQIRKLDTDWQAWWENGPRQAVLAVSQPVDLAAMHDDELLARAERILETWEKPLHQRLSAASALRADGWLKLLVTVAAGPRRRNGIMAGLMTGLENPTFELNEELWQLSRLVRQDKKVLAMVLAGTPEGLASFPEGQKFLERFEQFLEKYGHREGTCWYITTPTWRQDPRQVWRLLASLVDSEQRPGNPEENRARRLADLALVEKRLRFVPGLLLLFRWLLVRLCRLNTFRECSHFDLTRPLDALQQIAAEWGRRLAGRGVLETEDDVGYLTYEEIREWLRGHHPSPEEARALVGRRRATYKIVNARWQAERFGDKAKGRALKGNAASPGVARGRARIIRGEHEFGKLQMGDVLVSSYTTPAWTPLFAAAAAVVTETGNVSSHAAIVAREYGIPAVMAVPGATRALKDGQEILVDGSRGVVNVKAIAKN